MKQLVVAQHASAVHHQRMASPRAINTHRRAAQATQRIVIVGGLLILSAIALLCIVLVASTFIET
jgi:CHASE3 domain sensor protein